MSIRSRLHGARWYQRFQAAMLAALNRRYERLVERRKRALLGELRGTVVEIGPGTGPNLRYYDRSVRWTGIEPNVFAHDYLRREAARLGITPELRTGTAEALPLADGSADAVVSTLVLCTVGDPAAALREVRRVLRPGGRFVFVEHVAAPRGSWYRRVQRLLRPLWGILADGCHPDRETGDAVERAGFARTRLDRFRLPLPVVGPHIAGWAEK